MTATLRLALLPTLLFAVSASADEPSLFSRRVAPVLRQRCLECHNSTRSRGGLDLSSRASLLRGGDDGPVVVVGKADESSLVKAVSGPKPVMPKKGGPLSAEQVADLRRWIDAGADWPKDVTLSPKPVVDASWWSLKPLTRPALPVSRDQVANPVDAFVRVALETKGLKPSPEADRATLIRRLTFNLHGLPPTPEEVEAFVRDGTTDAYEKLVDRLLASPRYGERWGRHWLDVVHYADTHGYDKDKRRDHAWPYRDYVIRSFNDDKPYPQFIREQLAGDVLFPDSPDGAVATGFVAAGPWDFVGHVELREGTVDKLKTRVLDRDDMLSSAMSTFVSLTVHCARCHDHKFDPIRQKDYYRLQAVFAGVERGHRSFDDPAAAARGRLLAERWTKLEAALAALVARSPELSGAEAEVKKLRQRLAALPRPASGKTSPTNGWHSGIEARPDVPKWVQVDLGESVPVDAVRLVPARPTDFRDTPGFGFPVRFKVELSDDPDFKGPIVLADHTADDFANPGDSVVSLVARGRKARFVRVSAGRLWKRQGDYCFALAELEVDSQGANVAAGKPVTALDSIEAGRWSRRHLVDGFDSRRQLPGAADPHAKDRAALETSLRQAEAKRQQVRDGVVEPGLLRELQQAEADLALVRRQIEALSSGGQVYAVVSRPPRAIHVLPRGNVEKPGEAVGPGALACVAALPSVFELNEPQAEGARRAALAEWVASPKNPLTWRSIANRVWHYHFGRGLVDTPNDFGANGGRPTHPELLDWLAAEVRQTGSLKRLHRLILTSRTYRQSSGHDRVMAQSDADNRWLWRQNRQRLDAESLRDAVLAVSGTLDLRMGGPGYELFRFKDDHSPVYDHSALEKIHDAATYRRTVYRFVVRSVPNPFLDCLDCADPNVNVPVRNTTLTALQALALLNDPFMVRQAEHFAARVQKSAGSTLEQVGLAVRLAMGRAPTGPERDALAAHARKHGLANACRVLFNANEFVFVD